MIKLNSKITKISVIGGVLVALGFTFFYLQFDYEERGDIEYFDFNIKTKGIDLIELDEPSPFKIFAVEGEYKEVNGKRVYGKFMFQLREENKNFYNEIGVYGDSQKTVVVFPIFTASAYSTPGFYTYYRGECDSSCLITEIKTILRTEIGGNAAQILKLLGYDFITDIDIDKNPHILDRFDKVILLHNEYVTKTEFDAITNHPKVIFLYPNALYAEVSVNYNENTITLIRGHQYPEEQIANGFDWKFDNSRYESNSDCLGMEFYRIDNGWMLNCYPELAIYKNNFLLKTIKEF